MTEASTNDQIIKLLQETRRAAYEAGYRDALRDQTAARLIAVAPAPTTEPQIEAPAPRASSSPAASQLDDAKQSPVNRAPWGTSSKAAGIALDRAGDRGISIDMVRAVARDELGYEIAESSVRSIFGDMIKRKQIRRGRNGRWHRLAHPPESAVQNTAAPPPENDRAAGDDSNGEQRWSRPNESPQPPRVIGLPLGMPESRAMREELEAPTRMVGT